MKKLFKLNDNLFFIDGYYYGVDKDAEIREGDSIYTEHGIYSNVEERWKGTFAYKIIFSTNPSLELPLLVFPDKENEIEKLSLEAYPLNLYKWADSPQQFDDLNGEYRSIWKNGYKANPAKFSEQQLIQAMEDAIMYFTINSQYPGGVSKWIKDYLQSKVKQVESFEVEYEGHWGIPTDWKLKFNSLSQIEALNVKYHQ